MTDMSNQDMLLLCIGALLAGMLLGALRKRPKQYKYSEKGAIGSQNREGRLSKVILWVTVGCLVLYAVSVIVLKLYGKI